MSYLATLLVTRRCEDKARTRVNHLRWRVAYVKTSNPLTIVRRSLVKMKFISTRAGVRVKRMKPQDAVIGSNQDLVYNADNMFILSILLVLSGCIKILFILTVELFFGVPLPFMPSPALVCKAGTEAKCIMKQGFLVSRFPEFMFKYISYFFFFSANALPFPAIGQAAPRMLGTSSFPSLCPAQD